MKILISFVVFMPLFSWAQDLALERRGDQVCAASRCYSRLAVLNPALAKEVEYLVPHLRAWAEWSRRVPDGRLPESVERLERIGGALLVVPANAQEVVDRLVSLNVRDLAVDLSPPHPLASIPFVGVVEWRDRAGREGTLRVMGKVVMEEGIFDIKMGELPAFREKFVRNVAIERTAGERVPLGDRSTEQTVRSVLAPFLAGKVVSMARIGFNSLRDRLQEKLQETVDALGPEVPL